MTTLEKQELVRLLTLYQSELVKKNEENIREAGNCRKNNQEKWNGEYFHGIKAQYEHAHRIIAKISVEIQREMKSYWEM